VEVLVIRSVLTLRAADGQSAALEEFYAQREILERARRFPGCRDAQLLRSLDGSTATHLVIADWDAPEDYQRWVDDPWRRAQSQHLADLLDTDPGAPVIGALFEPVADR
jgi:antibiotic biosynthesis monooxygenase (ABM) superfamily enzyme